MPNTLLALVGYAFLSYTILYARYDRFESMDRWPDIAAGSLTIDLLPPIWYANILVAASISLWLGNVLRDRIRSHAILLIPEARESVVLGVVALAAVPVGAALFLSRSGPWQQLAPAFCATALAVYAAGIAFRSRREDLAMVLPMAVVAVATVFAPGLGLATAQASAPLFVLTAVALSALLLVQSLSREAWRLRVMRVIENAGALTSVGHESSQLSGGEDEHHRDAIAFSKTLSRLESGATDVWHRRARAWVRAMNFVVRHDKAGEYIGTLRLGLLALVGILPAVMLSLIYDGPPHVVPALVIFMAFWESPLDVPGLRGVPRSLRAPLIFWAVVLRTVVTAIYGVATAHVVARPLLSLGWSLLKKDMATTINSLGITTIGTTAFVVALLPLFYMLRAFVLAKGGAALYPDSKNVRRGILLLVGWILVVPVPALLALGFLRPGQPDVVLRHVILISGSYLLFYGVLSWRYGRMDLARTG
jgi:hypothetical protein